MPAPKPSLRLQRRLLLLAGTGTVGAVGYRYLSSNEQHGTLNPHTFTPFILESRAKTSSTNSIFKLQPKGGGHDESLENIRCRAIWSVELKQPQLQIARSYTPLPSIENEASKIDDLRLLIRQEKGGEVSTYLHKLPEKSTIEIRGPHVELEIPENTQEVLFLAGGTGIAPALQVGEILRKRPNAKMNILWANRRSEDCKGAKSSSAGNLSNNLAWKRWLVMSEKVVRAQENNTELEDPIVQQLESFRESAMSRNEWNIQYFIDEERKLITNSDVTKHLQNSGYAPSPRGSKIILVSGPDGFIEHWAGKKVWMDGKEAQGPLGGQLARMDLRGWSVWKL